MEVHMGNLEIKRGTATIACIALLAVGLFTGFVIGNGQSASVSFAPSDNVSGSRYEWVVNRFIDGDSCEARLITVDGLEIFNLNIVYGIRLIGINTPERGKCGYADAKSTFKELLDGKIFHLISGNTKDDVDSFGRLLRYVDVGGIDIGLSLIKGGFTAAEFDSFDLINKTGPHARESAYRSADLTSADKCSASNN